MVDIFGLPLPSEGESLSFFLNPWYQSMGNTHLVARLKFAEDMSPNTSIHNVDQIRYRKTYVSGLIRYTDLLKSERQYFEDMVLQRIRREISEKEMDGFIPLTLEWSDEGRNFYMQGTFRWKISGWIEEKSPPAPEPLPEPEVTFEKSPKVTFRKVKTRLV